MLTFTGHAGFKYETEETIILMDPWMSRFGAFDRAWYQFPPNHNLGDTIRGMIESTKKDVFMNQSINPHHFCMPVVKNESDLIALRKAACNENTKFFLGTDSAPHLSLIHNS